MTAFRPLERGMKRRFRFASVGERDAFDIDHRARHSVHQASLSEMTGSLCFGQFPAGCRLRMTSWDPFEAASLRSGGCGYALFSHRKARGIPVRTAYREDHRHRACFRRVSYVFSRSIRHSGITVAASCNTGYRAYPYSWHTGGRYWCAPRNVPGRA